LLTVEGLCELKGYKCALLGNAEDEVTNCYTGDLLSDVMGNAEEGSVLITIQAHKNTIAVASLVGIRAVVLCNGRTSPEDMRKAAKDEGVTIIETKDNQFSASWKIAGLLGLK